MYNRRNTKRSVFMFCLFVVAVFTAAFGRSCYLERQERQEVRKVAYLLHLVIVDHCEQFNKPPSSLSTVSRNGRIFDLFLEEFNIDLSKSKIKPEMANTTEIRYGFWTLVYDPQELAGEWSYTITGYEYPGETVKFYAYSSSGG